MLCRYLDYTFRNRAAVKTFSMEKNIKRAVTAILDTFSQN